MSELWRFHLLGELRAVQGERTITRFRTTKTGGLLAYLVLHGSQVHSRDMLLDLFWSDSDVTAARNSLSVALNSLRRQFEPPRNPGSDPRGDFLIADRSTVRLRTDALSSDVSDFETAVALIPPDDSLDALLHVEQLYQGELLPGYYDDWVVSERERLAALYLQVVHRLIAVLLEQGDRDRAIGFLHRAAQIDPLDEETDRLMTQLTHPLRTRGIGKRVLKEAEEPPTSVAPTPSPAPQSPNTFGAFPVPFTRFFGREDELEQVVALLGSDKETRLLTLTGTGGAGKTRLSIESASRLRAVFPGGVYFVALSDLSTPAHIGDAIRDAMGLSRTAPVAPLAQVIAALATREPCLLVLDNLEHLIGNGPLDKHGAATVVRSLLGETTTTAILATSRQLLGLPGERELPVSPLPLPLSSNDSVEELLRSPAVQLFVNRAQTRRVDFRLTARNAPAVTQLCARLEGIPLAIELAASWAKLFTPAQMLEKLNAGFAFLGSRHPGVPARHKSLWAAAAWSYVLLPPELQRFFARLSVFRGGFTPEAATAFCSDTATPLPTERGLEYLTRLCDVSLLLTEETPAGPDEQLRMRLREPIRDFADGQLSPAERTETQERHAEYFCHFAVDVSTHLTGPEQQKWFDVLEADNDNLRAVLLRHAGDNTGLRITGAMGRFWTIRGYTREATDWYDQILTAPGNQEPSAARALALNGAGMVAYHRTDLPAARVYFEESLRIGQELLDTATNVKILMNLGNIAYRQGDNDEAEKQYEAGLVLAHSSDDSWGIASAVGSLGNVAQSRGDYPAARRYQEESLALSRQIGDTRMTAYTLHNLGNLAIFEGDRERARLLYEESLPGKRTLGDRRGVATLLTSLAYLDLQTGDFDATRQRLAEAIPLLREVEDRIGMLALLDCVAWYTQAVKSQFATALELWAASETGRASLSFPRSAINEAKFRILRESARTALDTQIATTAWTRGSSLSLDAAIQLALTEVRSENTGI